MGMGIVPTRDGGPQELWDAYLSETPDNGTGADGCEEYACSFVGGVVYRRRADECEEVSGYSWAGYTLRLCPRNRRGLSECTTHQGHNV